ncbi:uncharacterized protein [Aristolochia californica]|uniref:uncharacterized protein n=1 Tax=Aristolochia californica TaxID=171875 RepID=UPI0035D6B994
MVKQTTKNSSLDVPADEQWRSGSFYLHTPQKPLPPSARRRNNEVPPKVYTVHPREFRRLVQKLTGAPSPRRQHLRKMAPPPLPLDSRQYPPPMEPLPNALKENPSPRLHSLPVLPENKFSGFLSPSSNTPWLLLSPGTMAALEYGAAL